MRGKDREKMGKWGNGEMGELNQMNTSEPKWNQMEKLR